MCVALVSIRGGFHTCCLMSHMTTCLRGLQSEVLKPNTPPWWCKTNASLTRLSCIYYLGEEQRQGLRCRSKRNEGRRGNRKREANGGESQSSISSRRRSWGPRAARRLLRLLLWWCPPWKEQSSASLTFSTPPAGDPGALPQRCCSSTSSSPASPWSLCSSTSSSSSQSLTSGTHSSPHVDMSVRMSMSFTLLSHCDISEMQTYTTIKNNNNTYLIIVWHY